MYHIAIVEDEREYAEQLCQFLKQYEEEKNVKFEVTFFYDGAEILKDYQAIYDLILLDIEMPEVNGMDAADRIRQVDQDVVMMFITNMAQYAIRGYAVDAVDFVMKPITYYTFAVRLERAIRRVKKKDTGTVLLNFAGGMKKLSTRQIYYVESQNRMLYYHTDEGKFAIRGTMQSVEKELSPYHFVKCSHWYLVNLMYVTEISKDRAVVAGEELEISRRNKTAFMTELMNYIGGID